MLKLSLATAGLLDPAKLTAWTTDLQKDINAAVTRGMKAGGAVIENAARAALRSSLKVKNNGFVNSIRYKLLDKDKTRPPGLKIGSKVPFMGLHVWGGTITAKMLLPLTDAGRRMPYKRFRMIITGLMKSGNAYFIKHNGKVILMAENLKENDWALKKFKSAHRARTGAPLKRTTEIPIAILVPRVVIPARFNLPGVVQAGLPGLAAAITAEMEKL